MVGVRVGLGLECCSKKAPRLAYCGVGGGWNRVGLVAGVEIQHQDDAVTEGREVALGLNAARLLPSQLVRSPPSNTHPSTHPPIPFHPSQPIPETDRNSWRSCRHSPTASGDTKSSATLMLDRRLRTCIMTERER